MVKAFTSFAYIYLGSEEGDSQRDRATITAGGLTATMVAVPTENEAIHVARALAKDGAMAIDLCAAFSSATLASVIEAVGPDVAVGRTTYGLEAVQALSRYQEPAGV